MIGAVGGALAGVIAGFVPVRRDVAARRQAERIRAVQEAAAAQAAWEAVGVPSAGMPAGPAGLLRADRGVVPFRGRDSELARLRDWCKSGESGPVRVLIGAGGTGKTRLALQIAAEWAAKGTEWQLVAAGQAEWELVAVGQEAGAVTAARGVTAGPVLLVVDYAETRSGLGELLGAVLADRGVVRVLLVARSLGEWWDRLIEESPQPVARMLTTERPVQLDAPVAAKVTDEELAADAVPYFAQALGVPAPDPVAFELPKRRAPVLVLHAAALVAVLRARSDPPIPLRVVVNQGVLKELLHHEAFYWRHTAAATGLSVDGEVIKPVVAAATLLGADDIEEAVRVVARVPNLGGATEADQRRWARWLYALYPAEADGRSGSLQSARTDLNKPLGSVQPDLLAETFVTYQLDASPELANRCLRDLPRKQAGHALTVLARARAHQDRAARLIATALREDLEHLAIPAARVALQTSADLGVQLAAALHEAPASSQLLAKIAAELPAPSVVLARAHLAVTLRILKGLPTDAAPEIRARWNDRAAVFLWEVGRSRHALPVAERAVAIYRELDAALPDGYRSELSHSLITLGLCFSGLGASRDALPVTEEAVAIYRELPGQDASLAAALTNLGVCLSDLGRLHDALPVTEEAVAIRRRLPGWHRPDLAASLTNLAFQLAAVGRSSEALPLAEEAVAIRRDLAAALPDRYSPDLAQSLTNLGVRYAELGRLDEALLVTEETVAIFRKLATALPDRYRPDLAKSLTNLGVWLRDLGRRSDALPVLGEAVTIRRELAAALPDLYQLDLAKCLSTLGALFFDLGRLDDALPIVQEAVAAYRQMPGECPPDLALTLTNLGAVLWMLGRLDDALPVIEEAVAAYRELPGEYRPALAHSLSILGDWYVELDRLGDALLVIEEAVAAFRELPGEYRPALARSLTILGALLSRLGRPEDALPVTEQAVAAYRQLPDVNRPELARSLTVFGALLSELGRPEDALPVTEEAVATYRELTAALTDRYTFRLARSLDNLADVLRTLGQVIESEEARREAAALLDTNQQRGGTDEI
jgi:tetratricopeptide (TPR) repeat protein